MSFAFASMSHGEKFSTTFVSIGFEPPVNCTNAEGLERVVVGVASNWNA